ncbi:MAG: DUF4250 domain-containing protein, partial [Clostridia bacterium]|nr:DUF4250 domain-containing protein [Clostridia bacterium]
DRRFVYETSIINTKLRDKYSFLQELCEEEDADICAVVSRLGAIGYEYDGARNCFSLK